MDIRSGILSTAQALGVSPVDLATAISYETAGTFDPTKRGPTTQWGQHRGLIQFGEPQAKKYGVNWDDPIGSQLGPQGAVANYLRDTGVKPGMGLLDIYSAINAGGVGRYNRSDANNGGAPGNVRDKVENQMAGHRRKAQAMFGGGEQDTLLGGLSISPRAPADTLEAPVQAPAKATGLLGSLFPDMTAEKQDRVSMALSGLSMHPNQAVVQQAQQRMGDRREAAQEAKGAAKLQAQTNKTLQWLQSQAGSNPRAAQALSMLGQGVINAQQAVQMAMQKDEQPTPTDDMREYRMAVGQGFKGSLQDWILAQRTAGASSVTVNNSEGNPMLGTIPQGFEAFKNPDGSFGMRPVPGGPEDTAKADERKDANAETSSNVVSTAAARARTAYNERTLTGLPGQVAGQLNPANDNAELYRQVDVLKSNAKIENLNAMRAASPTGGALGSVTEKESAMLASAAGALDPASPTFLRDLDDYERTLMRVIHGSDAPPNSQPANGQGGLDFSAMSDEELDAFIAEQEGR